MARATLEIADIFRAYGPAWRRANAGHVGLTQLKVMSAIEACRTETLGLFLYRQGFGAFNFGYASAIAYTITALAVAISLLNLWLGKERE